MRFPLTREIWGLAWPAILRNLLNCASDRLTLAIVGHYDPSTVHYDGAGLGKMYSNITGLSVGLGITLGLATLCSQAFGAGRAAQDNPILLRRCAVLLSLALLYSTAAALFAEPMLRRFGQPADVAAASAAYAQVQLAGVPFYWAANAIQTVVDGLQMTRPGMYANMSSALLQLLLCVVMVHPRLLGWGFLGMAAARSVGGAACLAVLVVLVRRARLQRLVWVLPPLAAAARCAPGEGEPAAAGGAAAGAAASPARVLDAGALCAFVRVAAPSAVVMWLEWWSFEGFSLLVGLLPDATVLLAAHGTLFNVLVVFYMFFTGVSTALCASTGKYIGMGAPATAPHLVRISLALAVALALATAGALYLARWGVARLFQSNPAVVAAIAANMPGASLSVLGYAVLMTLYGACRGANRQYSVAAGTALGYASGIPLAWWLGLRLRWPRPLLGVWLGNVWALSFAAVWALVVVARLPWKELRPVGGRDALLAADHLEAPPALQPPPPEPLTWSQPAPAPLNEHVVERRDPAGGGTR